MKGAGAGVPAPGGVEDARGGVGVEAGGVAVEAGGVACGSAVCEEATKAGEALGAAPRMALEETLGEALTVADGASAWAVEAIGELA